MERGVGLADGRVGHAGGKESPLDIEKGHLVGRGERNGVRACARRSLSECGRLASRVDELRSERTSLEIHPDDAVVVQVLLWKTNDAVEAAVAVVENIAGAIARSACDPCYSLQAGGARPTPRRRP